MSLRAFLVTREDRLEKIFREFPELSSLSAIKLDSIDYEALYKVYKETLKGSIAIVFPFPLRPYYEPEPLSKQAAFALLCDRCVFFSPYPRPSRMLALVEDPLIEGDLLIWPGSLRRLIVNRI